MSKLLLGLAGAIGVGKSETASILHQLGFYTLAFADPMKQAVRTAFHLEAQWLLDDYKNVRHPYWQLTPREMFQRVGTEAFQTEFGTDFWIRNMAYRLQGISGNVVITDVRPGKDGYCHEADFIRSNGGIMIHVRGPARREQPAHTTNHSSNGLVPMLPGDLELFNTGTLLDLKQRVSALLETIHA